MLKNSDPRNSPIRPTWYAGGDTWLGEAWTMLHPPYTSMVLSFVVVGAVVSPSFSWAVLAAALAAYLAALGIGAHFLDQVPGMGSRYVRHWPSWALWTVGLAGVGVGIVIGVLGAVVLREPALLLFVGVQGVCALGYPLAPLFRGVLHRDSVFAVSWGSLPCLTSYYAQSGTLTLPVVLLALLFAAIAVLEIRVSRRSRQERRFRNAATGAPKVRERSESMLAWRPERILQALSAGTTLAAVILLTGRVLLMA